MRRWADPRFQETITSLTISHQGGQYSIPRPQGFESVSFHAEYVDPALDRKIKGGERVVCMAGDVRTTVMVHKEQRAVRVSLLRLGKQRFTPEYDPLKADR